MGGHGSLQASQEQVLKLSVGKERAEIGLTRVRIPLAQDCSGIGLAVTHPYWRPSRVVAAPAMLQRLVPRVRSSAQPRGHCRTRLCAENCPPHLRYHPPRSGLVQLQLWVTYGTQVASQAATMAVCAARAASLAARHWVLSVKYLRAARAEAAAAATLVAAAIRATVAAAAAAATSAIPTQNPIPVTAAPAAAIAAFPAAAAAAAATTAAAAANAANSFIVELASRERAAIEAHAVFATL